MRLNTCQAKNVKIRPCLMLVQDTAQRRELERATIVFELRENGEVTKTGRLGIPLVKPES
jgi:hypothetical protein